MKEALLLICMCAHLRSVAQCEIGRKTDAFTGTKTMWTKKVKVDWGGINRIVRSFNDNSCTYKTYISFTTIDTFSYVCLWESSDNCECAVQAIALKFGGTGIIMRNHPARTSVINANDGKTLTSLFPISEKELEVLVKNPVTRLRIVRRSCDDHQTTEEDMTDNIAASIQEIAKCFSDNR